MSDNSNYSMLSEVHLTRLKQMEKAKLAEKFARIEAECNNEQVSEFVSVGECKRRREHDGEERERIKELVRQEIQPIIETLRQENEQTLETFQKENNILRGQLKILADALAEQAAVIQTLQRQNFNPNGSDPLALSLGPLPSRFPINSEEELITLNAEITPENRHIYVNVFTTMMMAGGVTKNLRNILSDEVVKDYNIDGVQGKRALKTVEEFYSALIESIPVLDNDPAEKQLRKALQLQKNRVFKAKCMNKKLEKSLNSSNYSIEHDYKDFE